MKAAVYLGPEKLEIREVEKPSCKAGEALIKVKACAICGTDVRIYYHGQANVKPPHIIGHEIAGVVEQAGAGVKGVAEGDRVTVVTSVGCGKCRFCGKGYYNLCNETKALGYFWPGGFAEYVLIPEKSVSQNSIIKIPDGISFETASIIEPLSCCINGQEYLKIEKGDFVVVFGCGPIGIMHAELARAQGASKVAIIDVSEDKLELGRKFNGFVLVNSAKEDPVKKVLEMTRNEGADVIIVAAGSGKAQQQALEMAAKKARLSYFAGLPKESPTIEFNSNTLHYREISVYGAFASHGAQYRKAAELIEKGLIDASKMITHFYPLEKIEEAIRAVKSGKTLKAVIKIET